MLKISLYVPCRNGARTIAACIAGVKRQTLSPEEFFVIDDRSTDDTAAVAAARGVTVRPKEGQPGLAAARNMAVRVARNEWVASLDADCVAAPDWLEKLAACQEETGACAVGGRLRETVKRNMADRWRWVHMAQHWGDERVTNPLFMFGNNLLIRRSAVLDAGGYDELMLTNGEDADLSYRLRAKGCETVYTPAALVDHLRSDTVASILDTLWRYWRFGSRSYFGEIRLREVLRIAVRDHWPMWLDMVEKDVRSRRFDVLPVSMLMLPYMARRDWQLYRRQARAAAHGDR